MPSSALHKLRSFHQELYQHALQATHHISAMNTAEIAAYSRNFQASLPRSFFHSDIDKLVNSIETAQFMLFGDFHTLQHSQRGFLRILRHVRERYPSRPLMVALEIFSANDQATIDDFLAGQISEEVFLQRIDYHNKWGFPWEHYQPIVAFCASNKIGIAGINSQFDSPNRLIRRDAFAATILNRWVTDFPDQLCLCLIGEYHLADQHLLSYLLPTVRTIRVVNNIDEYYFSSAKLPAESTEYLQMADDFFCVQNTVPWIKWQSLAMWEELHSNRDGAPGEDYDPYTEHHYDFDYQLLHILKALNQFMSLGLNNSELSIFDLYLRPDRATLDYIKAKLKVSRGEFNALEQRAEADGFAYCSPSATVIIMDSNINRFTEIAGFYLYDRLHRIMPGHRLNLLERIERQICGTIAALVMNPRRASQWAVDTNLKNSLSDRTGSTGRPEKIKPLLYQELMQQPDAVFQNLSRWNDWDREQHFLISKQVGEIIGIEIFRQIIHGQAQLLEEDLRRAMSLSLPELMERWIHTETLRSAS